MKIGAVALNQRVGLIAVALVTAIVYSNGLRPDLGPAYNNLAIALYRADRIDDAIARLELAQGRGVANEAALKNLAQLRAMKAR